MIYGMDIDSSKIADLKYFSLCQLTNKIALGENEPKLGDILSLFVHPDVLSVRAINSLSGTSGEGEFSEGKKLVVDLKLNEKIIYASNISNSKVHVLNKNFTKTVDISIPEKIEGTDTSKLLSINKFKVSAHVYGVSNQKLDESTLLNHIYILVYASYIPTYELCYTTYTPLKISGLNTCYADGSKSFLREQGKFNEIVSPKWSPDGNSIAYIYQNKACKNLCISNLKTKSPLSLNKDISNNFLVKDILSFSWLNNDCIVYSANIEDEINIYSLNIKSKGVNQLTFNPPGILSLDPMCLDGGKKILFIRKDSSSSQIYQIDSSGTNYKSISSVKDILSFTLSYDNAFLGCVVDLHEGFNTLTIVDLVNEIEITPIENQEFRQITKIISRPLDNSFVFIANCEGKDNIFKFEYIKNKLINLTNNNANVRINDLTFNTDGSILYFSSDELGFCNIFTMDLKSKIKNQILSSNSEKIYIDYRPTI